MALNPRPGSSPPLPHPTSLLFIYCVHCCLNLPPQSPLSCSLPASFFAYPLLPTAPLPPCPALQAFLGLSFMTEGLLLVFHLKGPRVEVMVHLILVLQVFATGGRKGAAGRLPCCLNIVDGNSMLACPSPCLFPCPSPCPAPCPPPCAIRPSPPAVVAILGEIAAPRSILAASARPWLTMLQGAWWIQTAYIM